MKCEILEQVRFRNVKTIAKVIIKVVELGEYTIITSDDLTCVSKIYNSEWIRIKANITASPDGSMIVFDKKDFLNCFWKLPGDYVELIVGFNVKVSADNKKIIHKLQLNG